MKMIVGLGNPGRKYKKTRHNIGFRVLDAVDNADFAKKKQFKAEVYKNGDVVYCKPLTFMNSSGEAVRAIKDYYNIETGDITVVFDDKDLPLGTVRLRSRGSAAGHNGLKSMIQHLGTNEFNRVRIGIANDETGVYETAAFVLGRFTRAEEKQLPKVIAAALDGTNRIIENGLDPLSHEDFCVE